MQQVINFINSSVPQTSKVYFTFSIIDTSLRNSVRFCQLIEGSSTKLEFVEHNTVIFDISQFKVEPKAIKSFKSKEFEHSPLSFYMMSTKSPASGMTVATKYTILVDEVSCRDDIYPCTTSSALI